MRASYRRRIVWTGILVAGFLVLGLVMWVVDRLRSRTSGAG